jgi:hypothetical protein
MTNQNQDDDQDNEEVEIELSEYDLDANGYVTVRQWACVDSDGAYECGTDEDEALDRYNENIGGDLSRRCVCVETRLRVPRPVVTKVSIPNEAGEEDVESKASE